MVHELACKDMVMKKKKKKEEECFYWEMHSIVMHKLGSKHGGRQAIHKALDGSGMTRSHIRSKCFNYLRESNEKNEIYWLDLIHYSFGSAVTCVIGDSVSGAIVLAVFYVSYFVLIWKGNQVPLTVEIMHFVCICGVAIGYLVLTKQVMPVYKAHIGFALFVLINGSAMCFDLAMTHEK
eukprot:927808_1